jgi:hypothetical protein
MMDTERGWKQLAESGGSAEELGVRPDIEVKAAGGKTAVFCPLSKVHRYIQLV